MYSAEQGRFRVQIVGKKVTVFVKPPDSFTEVPQSIDIRELSDLRDMISAAQAALAAHDDEPEQ
jgi:hypothetical protein